MFEYAKEVIEKNIVDGYKKYNIQNNKRQEISKKLLDISAFERGSYELRSSKLLFIISSVFLIVTLGYMLFNGLSILPILISVLSLIKTIQYKGEINIQKVILKQEGKTCLELIKEVLGDNVLELDMDVLNWAREVLEGKKSAVECEMSKILSLVKDDKMMLEKISDYEEADKYFSNGNQLIMKLARDENELNDLTKNFNLCSNSLDDFLQEKVNYSDIHYENGISEVKKLIKRL